MHVDGELELNLDQEIRTSGFIVDPVTASSSTFAVHAGNWPPRAELIVSGASVSGAFELILARSGDAVGERDRYENVHVEEVTELDLLDGAIARLSFRTPLVGDGELDGARLDVNLSHRHVDSRSPH